MPPDENKKPREWMIGREGTGYGDNYTVPMLNFGEKVKVIEYSAYEALEKRNSELLETDMIRRLEYKDRVEAIARLEAEKVSHAAQIAKDFFKLQDKIKALEADLSVIKTSCTMFASKCEVLEAERNLLQKAADLYDLRTAERNNAVKERNELKAENEQLLTKLASKHTKMMETALQCDELRTAIASWKRDEEINIDHIKELKAELEQKEVYIRLLLKDKEVD